MGGVSNSKSNLVKSRKTGDGNVYGQSITDKIAFFGGTPVVQPSGADQAAFTDNSGGTKSDTIAAGVGIFTLPFYINLATIAAAADELTDYTLGFKFKILSVDFRVHTAVTTAAKLASLVVDIGATELTGGKVDLTSANCTPRGAAIAGSAVTAGNTGGASDTISIRSESVTAFAEGSGWLLLKIQNMDVADYIAASAAKWNELRTSLVTELNLLKGS